MSAIYAELLEAGAPDLPEGYFYRITTLAFLPIPVISIRKRHSFWPSTLVWEHTFHTWEFDTVEDYARACRVVYENAGLDAANRSRDALFRSMMGDHP